MYRPRSRGRTDAGHAATVAAARSGSDERPGLAQPHKYTVLDRRCVRGTQGVDQQDQPESVRSGARTSATVVRLRKRQHARQRERLRSAAEWLCIANIGQRQRISDARHGRRRLITVSAADISPSSVAVSTQRLGSASAATDTAFNFKQLVYFSPTKFTLAAVAFGYTAPTSGSSLGPSYTIQPQLAQPVNANVTLGGFWTFKNADINNAGSVERAWSIPIGFYVAWSPARANFAVLPIVTHEFNPNRTTLILDVAYLFNRHMLLNLAYGGLGISSSTTLPFASNLTFATNVNPRIFAASLYFLIGGESNLPPMPPPPPATAAPHNNI